jgi:DNA-binding Lrp family transcriptional regulator
MNAQLEDRALDRVLKKLDGFSEIVAVHTTNGRWDLVIELTCHSLIHFDHTMQRISLISGMRMSETNLLLKFNWSNRTFGR